MTLAEQYRKAYSQSNVVTLADYLHIVKSIDANAKMSKRDLGVYIQFSDGSHWRLGAAGRNAGTMLT